MPDSRVTPEFAFEDFTPGRIFELGTITADRNEMIEFARRFDPQPFHLDEEAGRNSLLGGLCASGWYTCCLWMRAFYDAVLARSTSQGSPGGTEFGWPKPMFPGDVVRARAEVLAARASRSRPGLGLVEMRAEMLRDEDVLFRSEFTGMFGTRG
jgi:acyl dehydratase